MASKSTESPATVAVAATAAVKVVAATTTSIEVIRQDHENFHPDSDRRLRYFVDPRTGSKRSISGCRLSVEFVPEEVIQEALGKVFDDIQEGTEDDDDNETKEKTKSKQKKNRTATRFENSELPSCVDLRKFMTPVEDQAGCNACTANAVLAGYEYIIRRLLQARQPNQDGPDLSRLFVYYNAREITCQQQKVLGIHVSGSDGIHVDDSGSSIEHTLLAIYTMGVCRDGTWPYKILHKNRVKNINKRPKENAYREAIDLKTLDTFQWSVPEYMFPKVIQDEEGNVKKGGNIDFNMEDGKKNDDKKKKEDNKKDKKKKRYSREERLWKMKHCLAEGYPFVFGLVLFREFDAAEKLGCVPMTNIDLSMEEDGTKLRPEAIESLKRERHGHHCMLCVGYMDSCQRFIVRNSWGTGWGDNGYCYIPYAYMTNRYLCKDIWRLNGPIESRYPSSNLLKDGIVDFSKDVWLHTDEDFDEEFYLSANEYSSMIFSLEEAVVVLAFIGNRVDGFESKEERDRLEKLGKEQYELDLDKTYEKIHELSLMKGLNACYLAAVSIVLAHEAAELAYSITAEFAFCDGVVTTEEKEYWEQLAEDLDLEEELAEQIWNDLFQEHPTAIDLVLIRPLKRFSRGRQVRQLQEKLVEEGYNVTNTNGWFLQDTRTAVIQFQRDSGIVPANGIVNQETWETLFSG